MHMCMLVHIHMYAHEYTRLGVFLDHSPLLSFETRSLTAEPETQAVTTLPVLRLQVCTAVA